MASYAHSYMHIALPIMLRQPIPEADKTPYNDDMHGQLKSLTLFLHPIMFPVLGTFVALTEISQFRIKRRSKFREKDVMRRLRMKLWLKHAITKYSFD